MNRTQSAASGLTLVGPARTDTGNQSQHLIFIQTVQPIGLAAITRLAGHPEEKDRIAAPYMAEIRLPSRTKPRQFHTVPIHIRRRLIRVIDNRHLNRYYKDHKYLNALFSLLLTVNHSETIFQERITHVSKKSDFPDYGVLPSSGWQHHQRTGVLAQANSPSSPLHKRINSTYASTPLCWTAASIFGEWNFANQTGFTARIHFPWSTTTTACIF